MSDLGMCGAVNSIIGAGPGDVLKRFLDRIPHRLAVARRGPVRSNSVLFHVDDSSGKATAVERVDPGIGLTAGPARPRAGALRRSSSQKTGPA